MAIII
ncbi:hypothetical protein KGM_205887A, partial [Danaus plexippus plexippus]